MSWLIAIGRFIGGLLSELWAQVFQQWREPAEVREVGGDPELEKDIEDDITEANEGK